MPDLSFPPLDVSAPDRVAALLDRLTLDEKISLLHGDDPEGDSLGEAGHVRGVPRLGIPALRLADGPVGPRLTARATALPAPVALAATFSPELAESFGGVIGHEARALGQDVLLSPMVNQIRTPYGGRNFETFSEDPLLCADLVTAEIRGIQAQGTIATVKHLAANNQEHRRTSVDATVDEQTLREMDLPGFEAAVRAGVGSVMAAYNSVNGAFSCENADLLTTLLRDEWGFTGFVMSDWWATHSVGPSLLAGLDMEMPTGEYFGIRLKKAVLDGDVPEDYVDRAVRRVLTVMDRFGLLDGSAPSRPARDATAGARATQEIAIAAAVLLRNDRGALPLTGHGARSLAVIGLSGAVPFVSGGGSSHVIPDSATSPVDAIRHRAGEDASVTYALGADYFGKPVPDAALSPAASFDRTGPDALAPDDSWTYEGTLTVDEDDEWTFVVHWSQRDEFGPVTRPGIALDGTDLFPELPDLEELFAGGLTGTTPDGLRTRSITVPLAAGAHSLSVDARGGADGLNFRLQHLTSATRASDTAEAVRAARSADSVVLFAWQDTTEGEDLGTLALPAAQNELIAAVAAANPRTVVVLNSSTCVTMPWLDDVAAVLQMWYSGQQGAEATAALLFGDEAPGGKLPLTFPADENSHPVAGDPDSYPGVDDKVTYKEGIHVGYRWYDAHDVTPLFPFGHGLSYTEFAYGDLRTTPVGLGFDVSFTVRNTGSRRGTEVAQVYVGPAERLELPQAVRALAAYQRLSLEPGEVQQVVLHVGRRQLSSWSAATHRWLHGSGERDVAVGSSSRDLRLHGSVVVPEHE
ncbi:beta-glucosidase [Streptomyces umbrinus]|uniref:beta-glucosidase n=1 Tax=Streptomyces umbrinus TaxID=67370 RepID=UPI003430EFD5